MVPAKYPRTPHLPNSPNPTEDDKRLSSAAHFLNREIVILEKIDGSNVDMTSEHVFARSHSGPPKHKSFNVAKALHAEAKGRIDPGVSVFGEYVFAVHSAVYNALPGYFLVFGLRNDQTGEWAEWDLVEFYAKRVGFAAVPVLFRGTVKTEKELFKLTDKLGREPSTFGGTREGTVTRVADSFQNADFAKSVAKWVVEGFIKTDKHWMEGEIKKQKVVLP